MKTILKTVCAHCRKPMGETDGEGIEGNSHSICEDCWYERYPGLYPDWQQSLEAAVERVNMARLVWRIALLEENMKPVGCGDKP